MKSVSTPYWNRWPDANRVRVAPPRLGLLTRELPAFFRLHTAATFAAPVAVPAQGSGQKVMLLPGFLAAHDSMALLYKSLSAAGFDVAHWGLGRNRGARADTLDHIDAQVRDFGGGAPVALVGWSLGGLMAREYAKAFPDRIRQVITLGSPFSGDIAETTNVGGVYRRVTGHAPEHAPFAQGLAQKPAVPTHAFWSHRDSVVAPSSSRGLPMEADTRTEMQCPHMGFAICPDTIKAVARLLATA